MQETSTTNDHEILHPPQELSAGEFKDRMAGVYGINGKNPAERIAQLKNLSVEGVAIMLEDINMSVQGSQDSLISHDRVVKIGEQETIPIEDRYDVFCKLMEDIKAAPENINPARVADTLALGVVLIHPFNDGNGRTARLIGLLFRDDQDFESDFKIAAESQGKARQRGEFVIEGYTPQIKEGFDRSNALQVSDYLSGLLKDEAKGSYRSCYGQAPLHDLSNIDQA